MRPTLVRPLLAMGLLAVSLPMHARLSALPQPEDKALQEQASGVRFGYPGKASDVTRTIRIIATDDRFQPATIDVKVGQTIRFTIANRGRTAHEFVIGDLAEQQEHEKEMTAMPTMKMDDDSNSVSIDAGQTSSLIWTFTRPGTLHYACHVPGHYAAGMQGQLNVHG